MFKFYICGLFIFRNKTITLINENVSDFVRTNPRLAPVRAYYHAVLSIFNGDGNLWEDLQSISTITAFNQYYHIYAGVFVAFFGLRINSSELVDSSIINFKGVLFGF